MPETKVHGMPILEVQHKNSILKQVRYLLPKQIQSYHGTHNVHQLHVNFTIRYSWICQENKWLRSTSFRLCKTSMIFNLG